MNPALVDSKNNLEHESGEGDRERESHTFGVDRGDRGGGMVESRGRGAVESIGRGAAGGASRHLQCCP